MRYYLRNNVLFLIYTLLICCFSYESNKRISFPVQIILSNQSSLIKSKNNEYLISYKSFENKDIHKKSKKWACFLSVDDYEAKMKQFFEPRDLRLFSCMFNIDPFEINQTEILIIGSKKKVGSILVNLFKQNKIKYGRIKNRYHINMTNMDIINLITILNFKTIIDLSNDVEINTIIENLFTKQKVDLIRTFPIVSQTTDQIPKYKGTTIITDKIFNPIFYPNSMHTRETGDLNYYLFDKYYLNSLQQPKYDKNQKYSSAREIANLILKLIMKKETSNSDKLIDLRSNSKTADEIIQKVESFKQSKDLNVGPFEYSIEEIEGHYKESHDSSVITSQTDYIYTSHVTIVSNSERVVQRYKKVCKVVNDALESFYGMMSIEFICVTNIQPDEYSQFDFLNELGELKKHHILISIPLRLLNSIKKQYGIYYFPEYFLRNIGLRRSRGRYMLSGSSDVIMPPHFFLGIRKHLFSKNFLLRTIRKNVNEYLVPRSIKFASLFNSFVKNNFFRNKIVNTEFPNKCNMPCNPRNRDCGDFQGFHCDFWYKMNAYYNGYENYNVDSLLDYHLLGMFSPIMYKLMFGEHHVLHPPQSKGTPELKSDIYCNSMNIKEGIFKPPFDGSPDWGFINVSMPTRYSYKL